MGIGCRVPGAAGVTEFWRMLLAGRDATGAPPPGRPGTRRAGYLPDIDTFDNDWFAISGREAALMDPQQRLALEVAVEAIDDAGIGYRTRGSGAAVVFGACAYDHGIAVLGRGGHDAPYAVTGSALSIIANRLSYVLDLHGPSLVVDSACSSSLAAVDLAMRLLADDAVPFAIVGGVQLTLLPHTSEYLADSGFLAPDGRSKPFDAAADGYARSDGCTVVVMRRTADALRDGQRVYAEILGAAVGSDGRSNGLYAPNGRAQQDTIRTAWARAGLEPRDSGYFECHGTGTPLGDAVEVGALAAVIGDDTAPTWIGSIKSNIGHLEAAAGVTGMVKAALSIRHGVIAPTTNFHTENPLLRLAEHGLRVPTEPIDWTATPVGARYAGVSSFGFGGTNAHVVLRGIEAERHRGYETPVLIPVTGRDVAELRTRAQRWAELLDGADASPGADSAAGAVETGRSGTDTLRQFTSATSRLIPELARAAILAHDRSDAVTQLRALADGDSGAGVIGTSSVRRRGAMLFLFSGQGGQHARMGRALAARYPVFAEAVTAAADAIVAAGGARVWTPRNGFALGGAAANNGPSATELVQPAIFAFQVALAELLAAWGVEADAVVGHSLGEVAGAAVSGALSLADAARVAVQRSRILARLDGHGATALLEATPDEAARLVEPLHATVGIAAINGPRSVVISGAPRYIDALIRRAGRRKMFAQRIGVDFAAHSPQVGALLPEFVDALGAITARVPSVPVYSTARRGETITTAAMDAGYWAENSSGTVELAVALEQAARDGFTSVLEIAPHPVLIPAIREYPDFADAAHAVTNRDDEAATFLTCLAELYLEGRQVNWAANGPFTAAPPPRQWVKRQFPLVTTLDAGVAGYHGTAIRPGVSGSTSTSTGTNHSTASGINGSTTSSRDINGGTTSNRHIDDGTTSSRHIDSTTTSSRHIDDGTTSGTSVNSGTTFGRDINGGTTFRPDTDHRTANDPGGNFGTASGRDIESGTIFRTAAHQFTAKNPGGNSGTASDRDIDDGTIFRPDTDHSAAEDPGGNTGTTFGRDIDGDTIFRPDTDHRTANDPGGNSGRDIDGDTTFRPAAHQFTAKNPGGDTGTASDRDIDGGTTFRPDTDHRTANDPGGNSDRDIDGDTTFRPAAHHRTANDPGGNSGTASGRGVDHDITSDAGVNDDTTADPRINNRITSTVGINGSTAAGRAVGHGTAPDADQRTVGDSGTAGVHITGRRDVDASASEVVLAESEFPADDLDDHVVRGVPTVPAVFWLRRLLELARAGHISTAIADFVVHERTDLAALSTLTYRKTGGGKLQAEVTGAGTLASARLAGDPTPGDIVAWMRVVDANRAARRRMRILAPADFYDSLRAHHLQYGPGFRTLREIETGPDCAVGSFTAAAPHDGASPHRSAILDGCLHLLAAAGHDHLPDNAVPLPIGIESAWLSAEPELVLLEAHAFVRDRSAHGLTGDIIGTDQHGVPVLALSGVQIRFASLPLRPESTTHVGPFRYETWTPFEIHHSPDGNGDRIQRHPDPQRALVIGESPLAVRLARALDRTVPTERVAREPDAAGPIVSAVLAARTGSARAAVIVVWPADFGATPEFDRDGHANSIVTTTARVLDLLQRVQSEDATASVTIVLPHHGSAHRTTSSANRRTPPGTVPMAVAGLVRSLQLESGREVRLIWTDAAQSAVPSLCDLIVHAATAASTPSALPDELRITDGAIAARRFVPARPGSATPISIDPNGTYVVTGGLGALGSVVVRWLLDAGAHDVVVLTRAPRPVPALLDGLEDRIVVVRCDAADRSDLANALDDVRECGSTIRGVVHAAGALEDAAFEAVTAGQLARMFAPKLIAAGNLIELTASDPTDFVLLFSSATGAFGAPGQAAYASANAAMDALARAYPGRRVLSIGWGIWDSGLADAAGGAPHLRRAGISAFDIPRGTELFAQTMYYDQQYLLAVDYAPTTDSAPVAIRLRNLLTDRPTTPAQPNPAPPQHPAEPLTTTIRTMLAATLDLTAEHLDPEADFNELGLSSLLGIQLRRRLESRLDIRISTAELFQHPTITALGAVLAERIAAKSAELP
ncbi:SDR family NAD(P)-dependent oxidoreductase [Nocardia sp. CA-129566]|uniref:SDR family NAD(P)-dependent oxidoreductase n=1 Tax=Nocardia sp. CA-129566 TaxID=3239976 RepID=UPI003D96088C